MRRPVRIGITGGIGSGKSTLVAELARRGCAVFSADEQVHELYARDEALRGLLRERWGDQVVAVDGSIDRSRVSAIVFADAVERAWLESVVHPLVGAAWESFAAQASSAPAIVAEVPLLFEAGLEDRYDLTVLVTAPVEDRLRRVEARGVSAKDAHARMQAQLTEQERSNRAHLVLANTGTLDDMPQLADRVLEAARSLT